MHPIEQLRYVARSGGADARLLVEEAASALRIFGNDPAGLLTGCRRLLTRQPAVGPLWWMSTRLLLSPDPRSEARALIAELRSDTTGRQLLGALDDGPTVAVVGWPELLVEAIARRGDCSALIIDVDGLGGSLARRLERDDVAAESFDSSRLAGVVAEADLLVLEAVAAGPAAALLDVGGLAAAATARAVGRPVCLVVPLGCSLPEAYWQALVERVFDRRQPAFLASHEVVGFGLIDRLVRADGIFSTDEFDRQEPDCSVAAELLVEAR